MDETTQQNAALVEEAAAAAESLVEQASNLMDSVNKYRLHTQKPAARTTVTPARKPASAPIAHKAKPVTQSTSSSQQAQPKLAKTGTDNNEWEEF
jgi:methyl-accepting chemotaxis protein